VSASEQPQGVLLRYAGGEVYAVAGVRVAVTPMEPCPVWPAADGFETTATLTDLVAADAHHCRMAAEAAEHARVTLEMERTPKRPAKRTGKAKGKGRAKR